ncbi:tetratricopeptide repeat protein [Pedobacter sp. P351]|uniref:tetratricopeptide repeat protein n=1 Tax=Pedobacter superstes TaxID=3133441 RepID=UPI0030A77BC5
MSSNVSVVRQIAWLALIPQFLFALVLIFIYHQLRFPDPPFYGLVTYLIISFSVRTIIPHSHNKGMRYVKKDKFAEAIPCFEKSYTFFTRYNWVDKYRYITLLSSSSMSYREMSLTNIALCYSQLGDAIKAKEYYEITLEEFPGSEIAKSGLSLLVK